jgi:hypothetical protein
MFPVHLYSVIYIQDICYQVYEQIIKWKITAFWYIAPCSLVDDESDSSVSIVSGYELDDRAIEVRSPAEAKRFFL